jgi:hypothetical protein
MLNSHCIWTTGYFRLTRSFLLLLECSVAEAAMVGHGALFCWQPHTLLALYSIRLCLATQRSENVSVLSDLGMTNPLTATK